MFNVEVYLNCLLAILSWNAVAGLAIGIGFLIKKNR